MRDPFEDLPEVLPRTPRRPLVVAQPPAPPRPLVDDEEELGARIPSPRSTLAEAAADLHRAQLASGYLRADRAMVSFPAPRRTIFGLFHDYPWLFALIAGACIVILVLASAPTRTVISRYSQQGEDEIHVASAQAEPVPDGEHSILGQPTISADDINTVLAQYGSPAMGTGQIWFGLGKQYGIDPAYALAFFIEESSAGTNARWDGLKPDGSTTHNIGNISCAGYPRCLGRWRDYGSWEEGIQDWYRLIADEYVRDRGTSTVEQIIPIYAPSFENDVAAYIQVVVGLVDKWRHQGVSQ
jgi:hypothetical protein